jgi:hypothetical protein
VPVPQHGEVDFGGDVGEVGIHGGRQRRRRMTLGSDKRQSPSWSELGSDVGADRA